MTEPTVLYEVKNRIVTITLNRPEKMNAFNKEMSAALRDAWDRFENDADAQVAILCQCRHRVPQAGPSAGGSF